VGDCYHLFLPNFLDGDHRVQDREGRVLTRSHILVNARILWRRVCSEQLLSVRPQLDPDLFRIDDFVFHLSRSGCV
jgi:hypothetical protein